MATITLIDGTEVASDSPAWAAECLARHRHVQTMLRLDLEGRRDYLRRVVETEGPEARKRLEDAFSKAWEARSRG